MNAKQLCSLVARGYHNYFARAFEVPFQELSGTNSSFVFFLVARTCIVTQEGKDQCQSFIS